MARFRTVDWQKHLVTPSSIEAAGCIWDVRQDEAATTRAAIYLQLKHDAAFVENFEIVIKKRPPNEPSRAKTRVELLKKERKDKLVQSGTKASKVDEKIQEMWEVSRIMSLDSPFSALSV